MCVLVFAPALAIIIVGPGQAVNGQARQGKDGMNHEKRFTDNIKTDFVNFFRDEKLREDFDEDMRGLYEKCRKELERKDA